VRKAVETAREQVAELLGAQTWEILFTSCATESNNAAIHAALRAGTRKPHLITSAVEHSSVLAHCRALEAEEFRVTYLPVDREGLLDLADLEAALTDDTALVSLMWANNETGVLFPVQDIAQLCRSRGVLFHCDAVQAAGKLPIDVRTLPVDYLSVSGHKLHAPKGVGALFVRKKAPFTPLLHGGHQERGLRGGTESVPLIVALGKAAELARAELDGYDARVRPLRDRLESGLLANVPEAERNGHPVQRLANTSNLTFRGIASEALLLLLDQDGICASSGSACLADSDEPSHVVRAMKPASGASRQMVRFSLGAENTAADSDATAAAVQRAVVALRN
jgi:cysteine desulfurase